MITDFGLAAPAGSDAGRGDVSGTPAYMAPEQLSGKGASVQSDLYALGLVLYELHTGRRAFDGMSISELARKHAQEVPEPPSALAKNIDPTVEKIILKCLEKDPAAVKGMVRALVYVNAHPSEMLEFARTEFPTASEEDLKASLDRAFADGIYSSDGFIVPESWTTGETIVLEAGILKQHVGYDEVIDMRFVNEVKKELNVP